MGFTLVDFATGLLRTGAPDGEDFFKLGMVPCREEADLIELVGTVLCWGEGLVELVECWGEVLLELDMMPW